MLLFLQFEIGGDRYLLDASEVASVQPLPVLKALPGAPVGVAGVANYRGAAVPVIDLTLLATGRAAADRLSTRLVLVRYPAPRGAGVKILGLVAERATGVRRFKEEEFTAPGVDAAPWLGGVTPSGEPGGGMAQRVRVAELIPADLRAVLFHAVEEVA